MEKQLIVCASPHQHKYYFEPQFSDMPSSVKEELTEAVAAIAEKVNAVIGVGFYENGEIYIEQIEENDVFVDEIGAELEIKNFQKEKRELLKSIKLWYMIYRTEQGQYVKEIVLCQSKGMSEDAIFSYLEEEYGEEARVFAERLLAKA